MKSIEDFTNNLPVIGGWDEAKRIYQEARKIDSFARIELNGAHDLSEAGIQMVYAIGCGKINYGGEEKDALFYFSCMITEHFFGETRDGKIDAIPLERIHGIRQVQVSPESSYSRPLKGVV